MSTETETSKNPTRWRKVAFALHGLSKALAHRRQVARALRDADPHMLADLGVTAQDVQAAFSQPWWTDPTEQLRRCARERHEAIRAQGRERRQRLQEPRAAGDQAKPTHRAA